jgi:hypothetical protein
VLVEFSVFRSSYNTSSITAIHTPHLVLLIVVEGLLLTCSGGTKQRPPLSRDLSELRLKLRQLTFLFFLADSANSIIAMDNIARPNKIEREIRNLAIFRWQFAVQRDCLTWLGLREQSNGTGGRRLPENHARPSIGPTIVTVPGPIQRSPR